MVGILSTLACAAAVTHWCAEYIPSAVMIPQRRFSTLLNQARAYQRQRCIYHNAPLSTFSLYADHHCTMADFPTITTTILEVHNDEVWNIEWSHDGAYLASASKDKSAIIWRRGVRGSVFFQSCTSLMRGAVDDRRHVVAARLGGTAHPARAPVPRGVPRVVARRRDTPHERGALRQDVGCKGTFAFVRSRFT